MLRLIRLVALLLVFVIMNIGLILFCMMRPFHRNNVHVAAQTISKLSWIVGIKIILRNKEKFPKEPCVVIANHQNSYDVITVAGAVQPGTVSIGKKSIAMIPVFGLLYWISGNILIDRKNSKKSSGTINASVQKMVERKLSVWMFPEGTRSYGRGLLPFKLGAFRMAKAAKEAIVPVYVSNLHEKIFLNRWNNGVVILEYGDPVMLDDSKDVKEWAQYFHADMKSRIAELDKEVAQIENAG